MARTERTLRVKIPCRDEGDFWNRLADHVARNGIRVAASTPRPVGARVRVGLEFKDGRTLSGEAVVDRHVALEAGPGMSLRFVKLDREGLAAAAEPVGEAAPPEEISPEDVEPLPSPPPAPAPDLDLERELFGDLAADRAPSSLDASAEVAAQVARRGARLRRWGLALGGAALALAIAGTFAVRALAPGPQARVAAHVAAADRLLAEGRLVGEGGALERLLAAQRILPDDAATAERLSRAADLLERLGSSALERGDLAVAAIHLADARRAAPERASIAARLAALERARAASEAPARPPRRSRP